MSQKRGPGKVCPASFLPLPLHIPYSCQGFQSFGLKPRRLRQCVWEIPSSGPVSVSTEAQPVAQTPPRGGATSGFGPRQSSDCEAGSDRGAPHSLVPEVSALSTPGQGARSPVPQLKIPRATARTSDPTPYEDWRSRALQLRPGSAT